MDFGALPPEINSARMYSGPGSGPLLAAATGWEELVDELSSATASYGTVISRLTALSWHGPASASMAAAAAPYLAWMNTAAAQAEQTANQARAAAAAYEAAFAATVPPPVIAANRNLLLSLIATNIMGQNTPAIMATEAQYMEMWAQDAAAMYGYASSSAAAATLSPFPSPQQSANPAVLAAHGAVVARTTTTGVATNIQAALTQLTSTLPTVLQGPASPLSSASESATSSLNLLSPLVSVASSSVWVASAALLSSNQLISLSSSTSAATSAPALVSATGSARFGGGGMAAAVSAGTGRAVLVGSLSVPQTWTVVGPTASMGGAVGLEGSGVSAASPATAPEPGGTLCGFPLASPAGGSIHAVVPDARFLERPAMVPRWSTVG